MQMLIVLLLMIIVQYNFLYQKILKNVKSIEIKGCRCGEVIKGLIEPDECNLFRKICNPNNPMGACMVSEEGACSIHYKYRR